MCLAAAMVAAHTRGKRAAELRHQIWRPGKKFGLIPASAGTDWKPGGGHRLGLQTRVCAAAKWDPGL